MADEFATQREVDTLTRRVESMDQNGTRGVGVIQQQMNDVIKDVTELKMATQQWQNEHLAQHKDEAAAKAAARRWLVGFVLSNLIAIIIVMVEVYYKVH